MGRGEGVLAVWLPLRVPPKFIQIWKKHCVNAQEMCFLSRPELSCYSHFSNTKVYE